MAYKESTDRWYDAQYYYILLLIIILLENSQNNEICLMYWDAIIKIQEVILVKMGSKGNPDTQVKIILIGSV